MVPINGYKMLDTAQYLALMVCLLVSCFFTTFETFTTDIVQGDKFAVKTVPPERRVQPIGF